MFSKAFDYHKASSVAQAIELKSANPESSLIAGGHSLLPLMKLRQAQPSALIDIYGINELRGISVNNGTIRIGALTTHREIEDSHDIHHNCHMMTEVAGGVGDPHVRNRGTIGGNVVHADPASDWPTVLTALQASLVIQGQGGSRTVPVSEFFIGPLTTALGDNEVLTAVEVPTLGHHTLAEYAKMAHPATHFAVRCIASISHSHNLCRLYRIGTFTLSCHKCSRSSIPTSKRIIPYLIFEDSLHSCFVIFRLIAVMLNE